MAREPRSTLARLFTRLPGRADDARLEVDPSDALREANERFERAFFDAPIGMALVGIEGRWLQVNDALCSLTGYPREELHKKTFQDITHPDDVDVDVTLAGKLVAKEIPGYQLEKRYIRADGEIVWVLLSVSIVRDRSGSALYFISQILDISARKEAEEELQRMADHDAMTGLFNRRRFQEELERQLSYTRRYGTGCALLTLDLDNLKHVNDGRGHQAGDALIEATAWLLRDRLRLTDTLGRLGGDEFAVLLPESSQEQATIVAEKLVRAVREAQVPFGGDTLRSTTSVGVAVFHPDSPASGDELLATADLAMYRAKDEGGDRWAELPVETAERRAA